MPLDTPRLSGGGSNGADLLPGRTGTPPMFPQAPATCTARNTAARRHGPYCSHTANGRPYRQEGVLWTAPMIDRPLANGSTPSYSSYSSSRPSANGKPPLRPHTPTASLPHVDRARSRGCSPLYASGAQGPRRSRCERCTPLRFFSGLSLINGRLHTTGEGGTHAPPRMPAGRATAANKQQARESIPRLLPAEA
jgi:hypothetical protein